MQRIAKKDLHFVRGNVIINRKNPATRFAGTIFAFFAVKIGVFASFDPKKTG